MSAPGETYVDIALAVPSAGAFQYSVPSALLGQAKRGQRAFVKMRNRRMVGTIVGISQEKAVDEVKPIDSIVGDRPLLDENMLELTRWMSEHYFCSWGQAIDAALPAPFRKGKLFMKSRGATTRETAESDTPDDHPLTPEQDAAYREMTACADRKEACTFLLYGITGSGKTEVYMHLIRELLKKGRSSIVLVPEISLTPQTVNRFYSRFGDTVAVVHSRLSQGRRVEEWHRIRSGEAKVIVGARSAVFSPAQDLGLIILDEEHEGSYKQDETPRYHAREVAKKRIELENALLVLGSATPSLESYHASEKGEIRRLELPKRIENRPLPIVDVIDMRRQPREGKRERILSMALEDCIRETTAKKEQTMLLLNRRGFSTYLHCSSCGYVMTCPNCRISLAYHFDKATLVCHVCHYQAFTQKLCPGCEKNYLHYFGTGTQKVEQELRRLFPDARIGRMDTDSTARKDAHESILRAFKKHEIDVLIGTQMIAKGHDFPNVSLIGVISADTALHIPDFRSSERTFDLLTQVAGRAGRGGVPGRVLIQTLVPHHYAIQSAKDHDFLEFYEKEIELRRELSMPPFSRLVQVILRGLNEKNVVRHILELAKLFRAAGPAANVAVLGPAPALNSKENGQYFWNLYLKGPEIAGINAFIKETLSHFKKKGVTVIVDVDPD
jgi:primosomal protein N' (replication factor Y) (superfamily II helicase)